MITMHHFSNPIWFQELNSFEKEENNIYFIEYAEYLFKEYSSKVKLYYQF
jgi:beta-glucosidase